MPEIAINEDAGEIPAAPFRDRKRRNRPHRAAYTGLSLCAFGAFVTYSSLSHFFAPETIENGRNMSKGSIAGHWLLELLVRSATQKPRNRDNQQTYANEQHRCLREGHKYLRPIQWNSIDDTPLRVR